MFKEIIEMLSKTNGSHTSVHENLDTLRNPAENLIFYFRAICCSVTSYCTFYVKQTKPNRTLALSRVPWSQKILNYRTKWKSLRVFKRPEGDLLLLL